MAQSIILQSRPSGEASIDNFELIQLPDEQPADGDVLIATRFISVDPYLRGRMNDAKSYVAPFPLHEPVVSGGVGEVIASQNPAFSVGDVVCGYFPWQDVVLAKKGSGVLQSLEKVNVDGVSMTAYLGILGMPGQTAWVGLNEIGQPQSGETVFVSAASGAVGSTVGQIAKQLGCRVVGTAGSDEKVAYVLDDLGFDAAFNYRTEIDLSGKLEQLCPDGIDINYENVGGPISDTVFSQLNTHGRVIVCGLISRYQSSEVAAGPPLMSVLVKSIRIQGFIVSNFPERCKEWKKVGAEWLRAGKISYRESIVDGLENAPQALMDVLAGRNFGKHLVRVSS
ncbi:MAG: NADP-dependent oxidoreductase [Pseudomonadota bacterium]